MKPFDTLPPSAISSVIRTPVTLQSFEMSPQGMTPGAGVSSAAAGGKSYEIPPSMRSAAGALAEHAHQGAKSSGGCGCGGGCGPCGGAKASLMGGASGSGGAGAVMRAPAALRGFEMLPQGMNVGAGLPSAAGGMRGYKIPPNAKVAAQGLSGAPQKPKAYEIMPGAGVATRGLKGGACGCGGNCGPCGDSGGTKASANQLDPNILRTEVGVPISVGGVGLRSAETPPGVGGPSRCAIAEAAAAQLRRQAAALRGQANAIYARWDDCRTGRSLGDINNDICIALLDAHGRAQSAQDWTAARAYDAALMALCTPMNHPASVEPMYAVAVRRACEEHFPYPGDLIADLLAEAADLELRAEAILHACYQNPLGDAGAGLGGWCGFRCRGEGVSEFNTCANACLRDLRSGFSDPLSYDRCRNGCFRSFSQQRNACEDECRRSVWNFRGLLG